jgi:hypothetical protein
MNPLYNEFILIKYFFKNNKSTKSTGASDKVPA